MSDFDAKKEANDFSCAYGVKRDAVELLLTRCRDATEEADIKAVCVSCYTVGPPTRIDELTGWWHKTDLPHPCKAGPIHERRHPTGAHR